MTTTIPITRLNHFEAKPGGGDDLRRFLIGVIEIVRRAAGCQSCQLLESTDSPEKLVIIEVWDSIESHQAAAKAIPPSMMKEAMALVAAPVTGAYYHALGD